MNLRSNRIASLLFGAILLVLSSSGCVRPTSPKLETYLMGIDGAPGGSAYIVGMDAIYRIEGQQLRRVFAGNTLWNAVHVIGENDVYVAGGSVGDGRVMHFDGRSWSRLLVGNPENFQSIWAFSSRNVYALGYANIVYRYDGSSWSDLSASWPSVDSGIWGTSATKLLVTSRDGIRQYDGTGWSLWSESSEDNSYVIWGRSPSDVFASGGWGRISHFDGTSWSVQLAPCGQVFHDLWGSSSTDVFAVGNNGAIFHYDGTSWTRQESGSHARLTGVWGRSATDVFAVGYDATILHYDGSRWSRFVSQLDAL